MNVLEIIIKMPIVVDMSVMIEKNVERLTRRNYLIGWLEYAK